MFAVQIKREVKIILQRFTDYFIDFDKVQAVREIFGDETGKVLSDLKVEFCSRRGYMGVNDQDGHIIVSADYLKNGKERDLYLDIIHELVHVKQFFDGRELFDDAWEYVDRPTEIEAYRHTVNEARKQGMNNEEIYEYLRTEWISVEELRRLAKSVNVIPPDN